MRAERASHGPADSYTDLSIYVQCITRGLVGSVLPVAHSCRRTSISGWVTRAAISTATRSWWY